MSDLVERLRGSEWRDEDKKEAADEIERLRAALEKIVSDELYNFEFKWW